MVVATRHELRHRLAGRVRVGEVARKADPRGGERVEVGRRRMHVSPGAEAIGPATVEQQEYERWTAIHGGLLAKPVHRDNAGLRRPVVDEYEPVCRRFSSSASTAPRGPSSFRGPAPGGSPISLRSW